MECTVAVELCEKEEPPLHPENNGSTKKVKIRTEEEDPPPVVEIQEEEVDNGSEMISEEGRDNKDMVQAEPPEVESISPPLQR